jgi:hypothetical protein
MNKKLVNLSFLVFWIILGLGVYFRELWMPADLREKIGEDKAQMFVLVSIVFALWNLARYLVASRFDTPVQPSPEVQEYRRKIRAMSGYDPKVTDPQFNFDDPPAPPPGPNT